MPIVAFLLISASLLLLIVLTATDLNDSPTIDNDLSFFQSKQHIWNDPATKSFVFFIWKSQNIESTFSKRTPAATTGITSSNNNDNNNNLSKNNLSSGAEISDPLTTKLIFKGNLISRYGIPVAQQKICLIEATTSSSAVASTVTQPSCPVEVSPLATTTDDSGNFLLEYNLSESNFTGLID